MAGTRKDLRISAALGARIIERRQDAEMSQRALAAEAEISKSQVAHLEAGDNAPSVERLYQIARALGCAAGDLLPSFEDLDAWEVV